MNTFYRALLRLYPRGYRDEYDTELTRTYEELVRERGRIGASFAAITDVVPNAIAVHWSILEQDLRGAFRSLSRSRGFAAATILVTALGVGANVATFSVADFVLLRPLPFKEPERLVRLCEGPREGGGWGCMNQTAPAVFRDVQQRARSFESLGAFTRSSITLIGAGDPARIPAAVVTPEVLPILGIPPFAGRYFDTTNPQADAQAVVIGYGLWQSRFGGASSVLNSTISIDGTPRVVVGIMPPTFHFPTDEAQLWVPQIFSEQDFQNRANNYLEGIGRLKPGATFEQARAELQSIAIALGKEFPNDNPDIGFSFFKQRDEMSPRYRLSLLVLCGASLCMLLLTCANLANLSLARAAGKERELAVRAALGAGRSRLVRLMLTESIVLALLGGIAGALVAAITVPLLTRLVPTTLPMATVPTVDARVFAIAAGFSALAALGFGLLPALRVGGLKSFSALREGARGSAKRQRLRMTLVAVEVTVSVALLISSGLLIRAVMRVQAVPTGFSHEQVMTMRTQLPQPKYDSVRRVDFYNRVLAGVRALPNVEDAAYTSGLPMVFWGGITLILLPGEVDRRDGTQTASYRLVTSGFFRTMGIPVKAGRPITDEDIRGRTPVAVISESFAKRHWPNADPLGKTFTTRGIERTVVGVVGDINVRGLERQSEPQMYISHDQAQGNTGDFYLPKDLVVRTTRRDASLVPAIREIIRRVDPDQPIADVRTLTSVIDNQTITRRTQIRVLGALAALALLLAAVGIHGLLAFTVAQRDREIGVRLALGAEPSAVAKMIASEGVRMAVIGVIPGVIIAYAAARAMSSMLFGVSPNDPLTIGIAAAACFVATALACVRPAVRAARIDPISALRAE